MSIVDQICIGVLVLVILYIIFAPWLAQIGISKHTDDIAKELKEINETLKELKSSAERRESWRSLLSFP